MGDLLDLPTGSATEQPPSDQQQEPQGDALADQVANQARAEGPPPSAQPAATPVPANNNEPPKSAADYLELLNKESPDITQPKSAQDYLDLMDKQDAAQPAPLLPLAHNLVEQGAYTAAYVLGSANKVLNLFGYGIKDTLPSDNLPPEEKAELQKSGFLQKYNEMNTENSSSIGNMFIHPYATAMDVAKAGLAQTAKGIAYEGSSLAVGGIGGATKELASDIIHNTINLPLQGLTRLVGAAYEKLGGQLSPEAAKLLTDAVPEFGKNPKVDALRKVAYEYIDQKFGEPTTTEGRIVQSAVQVSPYFLGGEASLLRKGIGMLLSGAGGVESLDAAKKMGLGEKGQQVMQLLGSLPGLIHGNTPPAETLTPKIGLPPVPLDIAGAAETGATAPDAVYFGTREPTPAEQAQQRMGSQITQLYSDQAALPKEAPAPDIEGAARQAEPALFNEYDQLNARKDFYTKSLDDLMEKNKENVAQTAPHNEEIAALKEKLENANARKTKIYQAQIDELKKKNADYLAENTQPTGHSADIQTMRSALAAVSERLGHVNQDVEAARRAAQDDHERTQAIGVPEALKPPENALNEGAAPAAQAAESVTPTEPSIKEQFAAIEKDISEKMVKAGRLKEEADAYAKIAAAKYVARSERFEGKLGSPKEMYESRGTSIKAGRGVTAANELAQTAAERNKVDFENSKVVDAEGNLQTVYHGTKDDVKEKFDLDHPNRKDTGWLGEGVYATTEPPLAGSYANLKPEGSAAGPNTMPLHMNIENPFEIKGTMAGANIKNGLRFASKEEIRAFTRDLQDRGYDGVIWTLDDGTKEVVAFNPDSVRSATTGETLFQGTQGKIRLATEKTNAVITLMKTANASTIIHESGHDWTDELFRDADHPAAPQDIVDDAKALRKWAGIPEEADHRELNAKGKYVYEKQLEKIARGFERYIREGVSPSRELASVFAKFKAWLTDIYQHVKDLKSPINDEVRGVFDRLLTGEKKSPLVVPETKIGEHLANVHEHDAAETSPEHAASQWDTIQKEKDYLTKLYDPEVFDELNAKTGDQPAAATENTANGAAAWTTPGEAGAAKQPGAVNESADNAGGQGNPVRGPAETGGSPPAAAGEPAQPGAATTGAGESPAAGAATSTGGAAPAGESGPWNAKGEVGKPGRFLDKNGNLDKDALNYALYNNTPGWLQKFFNEYAERNQGTFNDPTGGVETLESMQTLMKATGWTPDEIRNMQIGQQRNRLQQLASAELFKQVVADVKEKAAAATSGDPKAVAAFYEATQEHSLLMQLFRDQQAYSAEASRNLGIRRAIKSISNDAEQFVELFQKITDKAPGDVAKQAEMLQKLDIPGQAEKFLKDGAQTPWQKFRSGILEYYINALISGPITHLRYSVGNAVNALATPLLEIPAAATIGKIREMWTGEKGVDRVYYGEAGAQLFAMAKGSREGLRAAYTAWKTGNSPSLPGESVSDMFLAKQQQGNAIPGTVGKVINVPSHAVSAIHSFFKSIRYEQELQGQAYRNAVREGLQGEDFNRRVADLSVNPTDDMMKTATTKALRELFMSPTEYKGFMGTITRATNSNMAAKIIVPFMKIGSQITRNAFIDRTLLGFTTEAGRSKLLYREGGAEGDLAVGKVAVGTALIATTAAMVLEGNATGDGPDDPKQQAIWRLNHRPNTVTIGSLTIPYQGLGPLGMLMRFAANTTETARLWNEEGGAKLAEGLLKGFSKAVLDENFMRGVKDMLDAVYHADEYGPAYLRSFATNWLPFSVGMSQMSHQVDPYLREVNLNNDYWTQLKDAAASKTPWLSEDLIPKRDRFGQPIPNSPEEAMARYKNDPTVAKMESLGVGMSRVERKILGVPLNDSQLEQYEATSGIVAKQYLDRLISNPGFNNLSNATQIILINKTVEEARKDARNVVLTDPKYPENLDIMRQAVQKKRQDILGNTP